MSKPFEYGVYLVNGTQIVHGNGAKRSDAFPAELNIPGKLHVFNAGHQNDVRTPAFSGPTGCLPFTTENRMPRHVHMSPTTASDGTFRYIVEKIMVLNGVALAELEGEIYVIPPMTMVIIGAGVPHAWVACPPGLDLRELGNSDTDVVSDGQFVAFFEYEAPTAFFPTAQTARLTDAEEYRRCDDLQSIRFPEMTLEEIKDQAWFVWGRKVDLLSGFHA